MNTLFNTNIKSYYTTRFIIFLLILIPCLQVIPYYIDIISYYLDIYWFTVDTAVSTETVTTAVPAGEIINIKIPPIILDIMNNCINNSDMFMGGVL